MQHPITYMYWYLLLLQLCNVPWQEIKSSPCCTDLACGSRPVENFWGCVSNLTKAIFGAGMMVSLIKVEQSFRGRIKKYIVPASMDHLTAPLFRAKMARLPLPPSSSTL